ncbi:MAG: hydrogenase maturation protease [Rubrivivax sp.]
MKPLLVLAWGNRSRGDDALGPLLLDALQVAMTPRQHERVELMEAHQLQPEHALDLVGRTRVLLADVDPAAPAPFEVRAVGPLRDRTLASHALSPAALLAVLEQLQRGAVPPVTLLALPAQAFELGAAPGAGAQATLRAACAWALRWVDDCA